MSELVPHRCLRALDEIKSLLSHARTDAIDLVERIQRITDEALLPAQGIEAQSATTEGRGPKDESPVPEGCAQPLSNISREVNNGLG